MVGDPWRDAAGEDMNSVLIPNRAQASLDIHFQTASADPGSGASSSGSS